MDSPSKDIKCELLKYISEVKMYNEVEARKIVVLDFRSKEEFQAGCLYDFSINLPLDKISEELCESPRLLEDRLLEKFAHSDYLKCCINKCRRYFVAIVMADYKIKKEDINAYVYSQEEDKDKTYSKDIVLPLKLYNNLKSLKVRELGIYTKGFKLFREKFPFLLHSNQIIPSLFKGLNGFHGFPSIVLNDRLYVGDQYHACSMDVVKNLKITHIVNATQHVPNLFEDKNIKYFKVDIDDTPSYKITPYFKDVFNFIESAFTEDLSSETGSDNADVEPSQYLCNATSIDLMHIHNQHHSTDYQEERKITEKESFSSLIFDSAKKLADLGTNENSYDKLPTDNTNINLQAEFENECCLDVKDHIMQKEFKRFTSKFKNSNRVLIHCSLGVSRSGSFTILYLMKKFSLSYENALQICKYHREQSAPMSKFGYELEDFEKSNFSFLQE